MPHTRLSRTTVSLSLCMLVCHGCQQPGLNAREEDMEQTGPPAQTPQTKLGTEVSTMHEPPGGRLTLTSSSDSSPDTRRADTITSDRNGQDQLIANASQGNALTYARADTTITEANGKEVARKRPATAQLGSTEEQQAAAKKAKKRISPSSHKEYLQQT